MVTTSTERNPEQPNKSATTQSSKQQLSPIEHIYRQYFQPLVKYLRLTYGEGPPAPEDVAQQAFEKLNQRGELSSIENPRGFIWATARNLVLSAWRNKQVRDKHASDLGDAFLSEDSVEFDPERVYIAEEQINRVIALVKDMPVRRQRIFVLNRVHGLSPAEIARQLSIGRTAVVRHLAIATEIIAATLEGTDETGK